MVALVPKPSSPFNDENVCALLLSLKARLRESLATDMLVHNDFRKVDKQELVTLGVCMSFRSICAVW